MTRNLPILAVTLLMAMATAGCAGLPALRAPWSKRPESTAKTDHSKPANESLSADRVQRRAEAIEQFERDRNHAQYEATLNRWRQGEARGARDGARHLLARTPDDPDVQLLMAEILLFDENRAEARRLLDKLLAAHADRADAHHLLALLCDAEGNTTEALAHYEQALRLEPDNREYQLSCTAAREALGTAASATPAAQPPIPRSAAAPAAQRVSAAAGARLVR